MKRYANPLEQLNDIASRVESALADETSQVDFENIQIAIGFSLLGNSMSAGIGDVTEIINVPSYTTIPGTKSWMLGMANVRGNLLPIVDLEAFFGGVAQSSRRQQRVLVIESGSHRCGLLVSKVSGLQNLEAGQFNKVDTDVLTELADYVDYQYEYDARTWSRFETSRLFESSEFISAASISKVGSASAA